MAAQSLTVVSNGNIDLQFSDLFFRPFPFYIRITSASVHDIEISLFPHQISLNSFISCMCSALSPHLRNSERIPFHPGVLYIFAALFACITSVADSGVSSSLTRHKCEQCLLEMFRTWATLFYKSLWFVNRPSTFSEGNFSNDLVILRFFSTFYELTSNFSPNFFFYSGFQLNFSRFWAEFNFLLKNCLFLKFLWCNFFAWLVVFLRVFVLEKFFQQYFSDFESFPWWVARAYGFCFNFFALNFSIWFDLENYLGEFYFPFSFFYGFFSLLILSLTGFYSLIYLEDLTIVIRYSLWCYQDFGLFRVREFSI